MPSRLQEATPPAALTAGGLPVEAGQEKLSGFCHGSGFRFRFLVTVARVTPCVSSGSPPILQPLGSLVLLLLTVSRHELPLLSRTVFLNRGSYVQFVWGSWTKYSDHLASLWNGKAIR